MSKSLEDVFEVGPTPFPSTAVTNPVNDENAYDYARDNLVSFIEKGKIALEDAIRIMQQSEHPRAVEVVSGLLKNMADVNKQLLELKKVNREINEPKKNGSEPQQIANQTNNSIFVGTSADLAKLIGGAPPKEIVIDVEPQP